YPAAGVRPQLCVGAVSPGAAPRYRPPGRPGCERAPSAVPHPEAPDVLVMQPTTLPERRVVGKGIFPFRGRQVEEAAPDCAGPSRVAIRLALRRPAWTLRRRTGRSRMSGRGSADPDTDRQRKDGDHHHAVVVVTVPAGTLRVSPAMPSPRSSSAIAIAVTTPVAICPLRAEESGGRTPPTPRVLSNTSTVPSPI